MLPSEYTCLAKRRRSPRLIESPMMTSAVPFSRSGRPGGVRTALGAKYIPTSSTFLVADPDLPWRKNPKPGQMPSSPVESRE